MNVCVRAGSCHNVQVDLLSVRYPLCASSFDSQNAAWNMAVSLAIKSLGDIMQLNSFDPVRIKRTEKVLTVLSHNTRETSKQSKGSSPDSNKF